MGKKKFGTFGSTKKEHRKQAGDSLKQLRSLVKQAKWDLRHGQCAGALSNLIYANRMAAILVTEKYHSGLQTHTAGKRGKQSMGSNKALQNVKLEFKAKCLR